jgi:hypothetical protein
MYTDLFFNLIGIYGATWLLIGLAYALFDYLFNTIMCWITGGLHAIRSSSLKKITPRSIIRGGKAFQNSLFHLFIAGGIQRWNEFKADSLSWAWPITILLIPTALYGLTRTGINNVVISLVKVGIPISAYRLPPYYWFGDNIQYIIWVISFVMAMEAFVRYSRYRTKLTWFSKSAVFHFTRVLLFDFVLSYFIINIFMLWLDFSTSFLRLLSDNSISYDIFNPDLMYGLKPAYDIVIGISFALVVISFLPTIMLIREKQEKYSFIYYYSIYTGLAVIFIFTGILIYYFNQRLQIIQAAALKNIVDGINLNIKTVPPGMNLNQISLGLQYYDLIKSLPNSFPIPFWFENILGFRVLVLIFEFLFLLSPKGEKRSMSEIIKRIIKGASK